MNMHCKESISKLIRTLFFKMQQWEWKAQRWNWQNQKMRFKIISHFVSTKHQRKHWIHSNIGKPYQRCIILTQTIVSFQFQSSIYKSILQVISHQIKDNMHNHHGSIGLFKVGYDFEGNLGFSGYSNTLWE